MNIPSLDSTCSRRDFLKGNFDGAPAEGEEAEQDGGQELVFVVKNDISVRERIVLASRAAFAVLAVKPVDAAEES